MTLKKFIESENAFRKLFREPGNLYPEDSKELTMEQKEALAARLTSKLSPENLSCDGELRGAQLQAKARILYAAKAELENMGIAVYG